MTHNPLSSSLDALTTEVLEALRQAGLKFTPVSHKGLNKYWRLARNQLSTNGNAYNRKLREENRTHDPPSSSSEALTLSYWRLYGEQGWKRRQQAISRGKYTLSNTLTLKSLK